MSLTTIKPLTVYHNKLWKTLKRDGNTREICMPVKKQQLESFMERLTGSGLRKEYDKAVYCHCFFNLYAENIMGNAGLDELQAGIKIFGRNINILRYTDDTSLMIESEEELKSL